MHVYEEKLLKALKSNGVRKLDELGALGMGTDSILWAIENLLKSGAIKVVKSKSYVATITQEGSKDLTLFPEEELVKSLIKSGKKADISSIKNNIGLIWAKKNGWVEVNGNSVSLTQAGEEIASGAKAYWQKDILKLISKDDKAVSKLAESGDEQLDNLVRRKLLSIKEKETISDVSITETGLKMLESEVSDEGKISSMSREVISGRKWETQRFKGYDVDAAVEPIYPARMHPMHELVNQIRKIWLNMGFVEVSGPIIESAFWNFDALFSPQDHPTRDMHDTFFLSNPSQIDIDDITLLNKVRSMHKKGWGEPWREGLAKKALLRTHTTSVSARYIKKFANEIESSYPIKLFSIGKAFRNESVDYKHLAELHMTDGIIIGNNLTLANLMYILERFYSKLGIKPMFKPSYFPFVEPGVEAYYYDERRKTYIELCGGGIIRREIAKAMGTSKTILAWGMGIDRMMFNLLDIDSLADLYKNDVDWLRNRGNLKI